MLATITPMLVLMLFVVSFFSWRSNRQYLVPQQILLKNEGIEFASRDSTGRLPWSTYKYYLENRWSFFLWQPRGRRALPSDSESQLDQLPRQRYQIEPTPTIKPPINMVEQICLNHREKRQKPCRSRLWQKKPKSREQQKHPAKANHRTEQTKCPKSKLCGVISSGAEAKDDENKPRG